MSIKSSGGWWCFLTKRGNVHLYIFMSGISHIIFTRKKCFLLFFFFFFEYNLAKMYKIDTHIYFVSSSIKYFWRCTYWFKFVRFVCFVSVREELPNLIQERNNNDFIKFMLKRNYKKKQQHIRLRFLVCDFLNNFKLCIYTDR